MDGICFQNRKPTSMRGYAFHYSTVEHVLAPGQGIAVMVFSIEEKKSMVSMVIVLISSSHHAIVVYIVNSILWIPSTTLLFAKFFWSGGAKRRKSGAVKRGGAKRRKSGAVKRFKQDSHPVVTNHTPDAIDRVAVQTL
nr:chromo domain protein LHP1 [Tanacetum cinerariifolium]